MGLCNKRGIKTISLSLSLSLVAMIHGDDPQNFLVALSHLPNTMVDLPNTTVDLLNPMVDFLTPC